MKLSALMQQLTELQKNLGDVEVIVSDVSSFTTFVGDFEITEFEDEDATIYIDISVGGDLE